MTTIGTIPSTKQVETEYLTAPANPYMFGLEAYYKYHRDWLREDSQLADWLVDWNPNK